MPTFDGGHCFLTALLPIKTGNVVNQAGLISSPVHMVRDALSILPVAHQSPITEASIANSPFAKNRKTHFCRMAVIDDVIFNGRVPTNALTDQSDQTIPQPVDELPCPYLMLVIDFDAPNGTDTELRDYLCEVWRTIHGDLASVFGNCFGYDKKAASADGFADYIISCQLETTMPFNDYWPGAPPLKSMSMSTLVVGLLIPFVLVGIGLYVGLKFTQHLIPYIGSPWLYCIAILVIILFAAIAGIAFVYWMVMTRGTKPFPMAPNSDLRSILKSLYLQRELIEFAIRMQGRSAQELHDAFGTFLKKTNIDDLDNPTQLPGTISARKAI